MKGLLFVYRNEDESHHWAGTVPESGDGENGFKMKVESSPLRPMGW